MSTLAPSASSFALICSAYCLLTFSLTGLGAVSTNSLASFRPSPVSSRTTLITWIFLSPTAARTASNSVCSSTATAGAPAAMTGAGAPPGGGRVGQRAAPLRRHRPPLHHAALGLQLAHLADEVLNDLGGDHRVAVAEGGGGRALQGGPQPPDPHLAGGGKHQ